MGRLTLIVGGQKSGKSSTAARIAQRTGRAVVVVAPAEGSDEEMAERIARHRDDRPAHWVTVETFDLESTLEEVDPGAAVIIDALDTWLPHAMGEAGLFTDADVRALGEEGRAGFDEVLGRVDRLLDAAARRSGDLVIVAGQPGAGLHANSATARRYVDLHGLALRRISQRADEVLNVVAGRAQRIVDALDRDDATSEVPLEVRWTTGDPERALSVLVERVADAWRGGTSAVEAAARDRFAELATPPGSLGALEELGVRLASVAGRCPPPAPRAPALVLAAGDHGVHAAGVSAWPAELTGVVASAAASGAATSSVLSDEHGVRLVVLDVGVATAIEDHPRLVRRRVADGTRDLSQGPAMSVPEAAGAILAGADVASALVAEGADLLLTGEMGIANTTAAACLIAAFTGTSAGAVTGPGAGAEEDVLRRKVEVVEQAVARLGSDAAPLEILATVGGLEHAALVGVVLAGAAARVPVVLDGVNAVAAALAARELAPSSTRVSIAGHLSTEPGAAVGLGALDLEPLLDLEMRLGEGTGALLAVPLVRAACRVLADVATLDALGRTPGP